MNTDPATAGAPAAEHTPRRRPALHFIDSIVALVILAGAAFLYYETTKFDAVSDMLAQNIGPAMFPRILLILIVALTLTIPVEHLFISGGARRLDKNRSEDVPPITWITIVVVVAAVALMPYSGTILYMVFVCVALPVLWGEYRIRVIAPFAILFPAAITAIFEGILKVHFAPGLLGLLTR